MEKVIGAAFAALLVMVLSAFAFAEECPEIDGSLRFELYRQFPDFEIVFPETFGKDEQQKMAGLTGKTCPHLVMVQESVYVILLRQKRNGLYRIVMAEPALTESAGKWSVRMISEFSDDIPVLDKVQGGFYSDIVSGDKLTITRNSLAVQVTLLNGGEKYIYKGSGEAGFESCRVK